MSGGNPFAALGLPDSDDEESPRVAVVAAPVSKAATKTTAAAPAATKAQPKGTPVAKEEPKKADAKPTTAGNGKPQRDQRNANPKPNQERAERAPRNNDGELLSVYMFPVSYWF